MGVANANDGGNVQVTTSSHLFNIEILKPVGTSTMKAVQEGTSSSPTKFTWTAAADATWYNLYIYDGEVWKSNCIYSQKNIKGLEWSVQLKPGTYQAHLSPINVHNWTNSNFVTFTVKADTYTISYNMNGGSGSIGNQTKTYGQDLTLSSTKPTRTGYEFVGWNTNANATTAQYQPGGKYTGTSDITLYAVWRANTYIVSYNMNGGSGSIENQTKTYGQGLTLSSTKPTRTGYEFVGWNTDKNATTAQYQAGDKYTADSDATLYAIWKTDENSPQIIVDNKTVSAGSEVKVNVSLKNNPGISSMALTLKYDETRLELKTVNYNSAMGGQSMQPQSMGSPIMLNWISPIADYSSDGIYAELIFKILDKTESGTTPIEVTYESDNVYNLNGENIEFAVKDGTVNIRNYIPGDINNDGKVNNKDFSRLFQYLSGWDVEVNEAALDVNGDGSVNNKDATRLFQYVSGWNVDIY